MNSSYGALLLLAEVEVPPSHADELREGLRSVDRIKEKLQVALFKVCEHPDAIGYDGYEKCMECGGQRLSEPSWGEPIVWKEWTRKPGQ